MSAIVGDRGHYITRVAPASRSVARVDAALPRMRGPRRMTCPPAVAAVCYACRRRHRVALLVARGARRLCCWRASAGRDAGRHAGAGRGGHPHARSRRLGGALDTRGAGVCRRRRAPSKRAAGGDATPCARSSTASRRCKRAGRGRWPRSPSTAPTACRSRGKDGRRRCRRRALAGPAASFLVPTPLGLRLARARAGRRRRAAAAASASLVAEAALSIGRSAPSPSAAPSRSTRRSAR